MCVCVQRLLVFFAGASRCQRWSSCGADGAGAGLGAWGWGCAQVSKFSENLEAWVLHHNETVLVFVMESEGAARFVLLLVLAGVFKSLEAAVLTGTEHMLHPLT